MPKQTPNRNQQKAIDAREKKILVSASAGTGKTTVLTDRVMSLLTGQDGKEDQININQLLILTFTNNAAAHMRQKLEKSINETLSGEAKNHQLELLEEADITTISAYAEKLLKDYYYKVDIDPDFNLLSSDVAKERLRSRVWEDIVDNIYEDNPESPLSEEAKNLFYLLNEKTLKDKIFALYDFLSSLKDPEAWLENTQDMLNKASYTAGIKAIARKNKTRIQEISALFTEFEQRETRYQKYLAEHNFELSAEMKTKHATARNFVEAYKELFKVIQTEDFSWDNLKEINTRYNYAELPLFPKFSGKPYIGIPAAFPMDEINEVNEFTSDLKNQLKDLKDSFKADNFNDYLNSLCKVDIALFNQIQEKMGIITNIQTKLTQYYDNFPVRDEFQKKNFAETISMGAIQEWLVSLQKIQEEYLSFDCENSSDAEREEYLARGKEAVKPINTRKKAPQLSTKVDTVDYVLELGKDINIKENTNFLGEITGLISPKAENKFQQQRRMTSVFLDIYRLFANAYNKRKNNLSLFEFSDLERFALDLIKNNDDIRKELNQAYEEIIIDEYQDTNQLQDLILDMIAGDSTRRFMVGDVKQSIYGFRHADHTLFMDKEASYQDGKTENAVVIPLNENYRSRQEVLDPINKIFKELMQGEGKDLQYQGQELKAGNKLYEENLQNSKLEAFKVYNVPKEQDNAALGEAKFVASKIKEMMTQNIQIVDRENPDHPMRPLRYGDIAVISRSWTNNNLYFKEFEKQGIAYKATRSDKYLEQIEIRVALAYLKALSNNRDDISMVAVLHSPLYRMTDPELAFLRLVREFGSFYGILIQFKDLMINDRESLVNLAKEAGLENPDNFIDTLNAKIAYFMSDYNRLAAVFSVSSMTENVQNLLAMTEIVPAFAGLPQGTTRRSNLNGLVDYVADLEGANIEDVDSLRDALEGQKLDIISPESSTNSITYTTIHGSKGLEFPVVFLVNSETKFNTKSADGYVLWTSQDIMLSNISKKMLNEDTFTLEKNNMILKPTQEVIKEDITLENKRLLYVALTRAEQSLIVVGASKANGTENYFNWVKTNVGEEYYVDLTAEIAEDANQEVVTDEVSTAPNAQMKADFTVASTEKSQAEAITTRYAITEKTFKKKIKKAITDGFNPIKSATCAENPYDNEVDSKHVPADELGTAGHLVFEKHLDKEKYPSTNVRDTIKQLADEGLMSQAAATELLATFADGIQYFFDESFGKDMLISDEVYPEFEFSALVNTQETFGTEEEDFTVVHGFIDCFYKNPATGNYIIVDFKTDIRLGTEKVLAEAYDGQLRLYTQALQAMGKKVEAAYVYGIRHQDIFEINIDDLK